MTVSLRVRYRIGFVSDWDANDPKSMSGAAYYMRRAFRALGHETVDIFPTSKTWRARLLLGPGYFVKKAYELAGFYYSPKRHTSYIAAVSAFANRRISRDGHLDFIFSQSGVPVAGLDTDVPIFMTSDQPFHLYLEGYVPNPAKRFVQEGAALEEAVISRVARYIYPSQWAKNAFCKAHPRDQHIAECIPWGANLNEDPDGAIVAQDIAAKTRNRPYRFLFLGSDWKRKRGEFVLRTLDLLRQDGFDIALDVVGAGDVDVGGRPYVTVTSYIDKLSSTGSAAYIRLMRLAHFLFVPSQAEAYGHVFCEAAAFGVPSLTSAVGGIPSIIENRVNGLCLPLDTTEQQFADEIRKVLESQDSYVVMSHAARACFEADLSWTSFALKTIDLVERVTETRVEQACSSTGAP